MDKIYYPYPSTLKSKKYFIINSQGKKVHFGSATNKDYTIYYKEEGKDKAEQMKASYIARHSKLNEDWTKDGIDTAGFWSRWLLWEYPTIEESYKNIKKRFLSKK